MLRTATYCRRFYTEIGRGPYNAPPIEFVRTPITTAAMYRQKARIELRDRKTYYFFPFFFMRNETNELLCTIVVTVTIT